MKLLLYHINNGKSIPLHLPPCGLNGKDEVSKGGKQNPKSCVGKVGVQGATGGHGGSIPGDRDRQGEVRLIEACKRTSNDYKRSWRQRHF